MVEEMLNRIMLGAKTPAGKAIAIVLTVSLALMTWNASAMSAAFADDTEDALTANDVGLEEADAAASDSAVSTETNEASEPSVEEAADNEEVAVTDSADEEAADEEVVDEEGEEVADDASSIESTSQGEDVAVAADEAAGNVPHTAVSVGAGVTTSVKTVADALKADVAKEDPTKDDASKASADKGEEQYPATTLNDNGVIVKAPKGALPKGATMTAVRVADEQAVADAVEQAVADDVVVEEVVAYDITLYDAKGVEVQPKLPVQVVLSSASSLGEEAELYHMDDINAEAEKVADGISGEAEHFSIYAVVVTAAPGTSEYEKAGGRFDIKIRYEDENQNAIPGIEGDTYELTPGMSITVNQIVDQNQTIVVGDTTYTFENAYFYWTGHYGGQKCYITSFTASTYGNGEYASNLYFNGSLYNAAGTRVEQTGRWAYNPTGVLHLVYKTTQTPMHTVTYHSNYGQDQTSSYNVPEKTSVSALTYEAAFGEVPRNYTFLGWATSPSGSVQYAAGAQITRSITRDYDLYAVWQWADGDINVTYEADPAAGGRLSSTGEVLKLHHQQGRTDWWDNPNGSTASATDGYVFIGWYKDDTLVSSDLALSQSVIWNNMNRSGSGYADTTFTAKFEKNATITYVADPAAGGSVSRASESVSSGSLPQGSTAMANTADEYYFAGWYKDGAQVAGANVPTLTQTVIDQYAKDASGRYVDTTFTAKFNKYEEITLTANTDSLKYNGATQTLTGYTGLPDGKQFSDAQLAAISASGSGKDAGEYDVTFAVGAPTTLTATDGTVYKVTYEPGKLTITPRTITLTSAGGEKQYDGKPLTKNAQTDITVGGDGWAAGEGATYDITGSQTIVGESPNAFTYTLNEGTLAKNYNISTTEGTLKVTDRAEKFSVEVEANSGSFTYDGADKTASGLKTTTFTIGGVTFTVEGLSASSTEKNAGNYPVSVEGTAVVKDADGNNVTGQFVITKKAGTLAIAKRSVIITSASGEKQYDGSPLTKNNPETDIEVTGDGWAAGEGATYSITGSQTIVGDSSNTFTYTLNAGTFADNYTIQVNYGKLEVTSRDQKPLLEIKAKSNSDIIKYDGQEHSVPAELEQTVYEIDGHKYTVTELTVSGAKGTDAGDYPSTITGTPKILDEGGNDVTSQFRVSVTSGKLTITPRSVLLTSAGAEKEFDGKALVRNAQNDITVGGDGWADGEGAAYSITGSQTIVGESDNEFTYTLNDNTKASNYTITSSYGKLKVKDRTTKLEANLVANSNEITYDGNDHTVSGFARTSVTIDGVEYYVTGLTSTATAKHVSESVAEIEVTGEAHVYMYGTTVDVTDQFTVNVTKGHLTINPVELELTSAGAEKQYDGKALTRNAQTDVSVTKGAWVGSDGATYDITGSQTIVGESKNEFTYTLNTGIDAKDYDIKTAFGTLKVTDRNPKFSLVLQGNSDRVRYDGKAHTVEGFKIVESDTVKPLSEDGSKFSIDGIEFTLSGLSASATGTDYAENGYPSEITGMAVIKDAAGNDVTSQFDIGRNAGRLDIYRATFEVSEPEDMVYSGRSRRAPVTVTDDETGAVLAEGTDYTITWSYAVDATPEDEPVTITVTGINNYTNTVLKYYRILPKPITITTDSAEKTYDGNALTAGGAIEGIVENEVVTFVVTGSQTNVGESDNTYTLTWGGDAELDAGKRYAKESNYTIESIELGTLTVNPAAVTVTAKDVTKVYDGEAAEADGATVTGLIGSDTIEYTVAFAEGVDTTNVGDTEDAIVASGAAIQGNYAVTYVAGDLSITPRTVTLTSGTDKKTYDGNPLTNSDISVGGDGFITGEGATYNVTGSQTLVGESENAFTYTLSSGTLAKNYNITTVPGTLTVTDGTNPGDDPVDPDVIGTKSHEGADYKLGETITWTIRVTNIYDEAKDITLVEQEGFTLDRAFFANVAAGATISTTATHVVTEDDILAGAVNNTVNVQFGDININIPDPTPVDPEDKNGHMTIAKTTTSAPANGTAYVLGETITYQITATNDGNLTLTNVTVTDDLTGDSWQIASLAPGNDPRVFTASYTVTAADVANGSVVNNATATGASPDPDNPEPTVTPGTATVPTTPTPAPTPTPTPTPAPTPGGGGTTPAGGGDAPAAATPAAATPAATTGTGAASVTITGNPTPLAETIDNDANALASGAGQSAWSLFDLLCTILCVILTLAMLVGMIGRKRKEGEEDENGEREPDQITKRRRALKLISIIPAIAAVVALILTQDFSQPMVFFDQWSLMFGVIAIVDIVLRIASIRRKTDDDGDDEQHQQRTGYVPASPASL